MNTINCISCWGESSGSYDPSTANNGGGYWQFSGGALFSAADGRHVIIDVDDQSCGDFGSRVFCTVTVQSSTQALAWYVNLGNMDDACITSDEDEQAIYAGIAHVLGIVPEDVSDMVSDARRGADAQAE